ncbi:phosphoadenosine phosphosulfate reductase family protein [Aquamicrobium sp.]|uniref:phosphoadenosine phosphosulfate reductase domain-containing protein n=1 Tax=Aquamicrobium sp. TaxID=1872579 RepID=UPI00258943A4|nr:phosphoadenosine phosphosulfate reductase family protein [Aquamicrobium sp.]MCK9552327.1 phosphoadenosine phosphosulfate reductase family protein [Aquamicrobium sp.]
MSVNLFQANNVDFTTTLSPLTILSFGGGQDSTTLLFLYVFDEAFRQKYAPGRFLVLFADTGNEAPLTYDYIQRVVKPFCVEHNIEFVAITNDMGYHGETWQSLTHQWENGTPTIGSCAFQATCTHNLKIVPQHRFVEDWLQRTYPEIVVKNNRKQGYVQFAKHYGKIRWLIGIAKGEERRVADAKAETALWKKQAIHVEYPLIELGLDRQGCQDYINSIGKEIPFPSNCLYCAFCSEIEILWLEKAYPQKFNIWVKYEQAKLDAHAHVEKNLGVCGRLHKTGDRKGQAVTLLDLLEEAKRKYPNITLNELTENRFSHGHCVISKY